MSWSLSGFESLRSAAIVVFAVGLNGLIYVPASGRSNCHQRVPAWSPREGGQCRSSTVIGGQTYAPPNLGFTECPACPAHRIGTLMELAVKRFEGSRLFASTKGRSAQCSGRLLLVRGSPDAFNREHRRSADPARGRLALPWDDQSPKK